MSVPSVLRSGNHAAIAEWRDQCRIEKTRARRPDLLEDLHDAVDDAGPPPES
jgi:tRNA (guanine37-N1)-methyltransferase